MEKKTIKILYVSDDFNETSWNVYNSNLSDGIYFYHEEANKFLFDATLVRTIKDGLVESSNKTYDVILVDYGLIGNERKEFRKLINKEFVVLTGALDRQYIINDLTKSPFNYPQLDIVKFNVEELKGDLYHLLSEW